jgi:putative ABC transport system substrate-binding protein
MSGDPVAENLVSSLNRPTGNLTGVTTFSGVLTSKRLELLRELAPSARIAALMNPNNSNAKFRLKEIEEASRILDLQVEIVNTRNADEIDGAFASLLQRGIGWSSTILSLTALAANWSRWQCVTGFQR